MKNKRILLFSISLLLSYLLGAQTEPAKVVEGDSIDYTEPYGIRVGIDISKLARTALEDGFTGVEIQGDFRVTKRFYAALELGTEEREWDEVNLNSVATGSYFKIGADVNAYENWVGMNNMIFFGLRYGFATFKQELKGYRIYTTNPTFPSELQTVDLEYTGLTASWVELIFGVKTEVIRNLYLGINVQLKRLIAEDRPDNFDNLIIPGYNRTYDFSEFGAGYGFTVSYLVPIFRK
jgi:hypothetical protein